MDGWRCSVDLLPVLWGAKGPPSFYPFPFLLLLGWRLPPCSELPLDALSLFWRAWYLKMCACTNLVFRRTPSPPSLPMTFLVTYLSSSLPSLVYNLLPNGRFGPSMPNSQLSVTLLVFVLRRFERCFSPFSHPPIKDISVPVRRLA